MKSFRHLLIATGLLFSLVSFAGKPSELPNYEQLQTNKGQQQDCYNGGKVLPVMNEEAIQWKTKVSGYQTRVLVSGTVDEVYADKSGHRHFSLKIGAHNDDRVEVIYNVSFGAMPLPVVGDEAEACGDYIVATKKNGSFPPSPDGAIVHWVHKSTRKGHDDGFVILNGVVYGNEDDKGGGNNNNDNGGGRRKGH